MYYHWEFTSTFLPLSYLFRSPLLTLYFHNSFLFFSMEELKLRLLSDDFGKHLMGVEDLLQKHSLVEADINVLGERVKQVLSLNQE